MTVNVSRASRWQGVVPALQHAFQPVVNIHSGACVGYEALLRNVAAAGFGSIDSVFDAAVEDGYVFQLERDLLRKALQAFVQIPHHAKTRLFFNFDNRVLGMPDYEPGWTEPVLKSVGLSLNTLCFELSERHEMIVHQSYSDVVTAYRRQGFRVAIDDFGRGFSGLKQLYEVQADYLKVDRFFISRIDHDRRKRIFFSYIVNMAHAIGMTVLAEGVETEGELAVCREIGCDLVQGFFVQRPTTRTDDLLIEYPHVAAVGRRSRRMTSDRSIVAASIEKLPTLRASDSIMTVFEAFKNHHETTFFPVVDDNDDPVGVVREETLKDYVYAPFGRDLLSNRTFRTRIGDVVSPCPVADINAGAEQIIEIFTTAGGREGIIVTQDLKYAGFLQPQALLSIVTEKNLSAARDQNPLSKLPGNTVIFEYVSKALSEPEETYLLAYFDFDNFKPFNDKYGFRQGDRVLLLFAEILRKELSGSKFFLGHVGGDDFFAGCATSDLAVDAEAIRAVAERFRNDVQSFYHPKDRERGGIEANDRSGTPRFYPLLTVSVVLVELPANRGSVTPDEISGLLAAKKSEAKSDASGLVTVRLGSDRFDF